MRLSAPDILTACPFHKRSETSVQRPAACIFRYSASAPRNDPSIPADVPAFIRNGKQGTEKSCGIAPIREIRRCPAGIGQTGRGNVPGIDEQHAFETVADIEGGYGHFPDTDLPRPFIRRYAGLFGQAVHDSIISCLTDPCVSIIPVCGHMG